MAANFALSPFSFPIGVANCGTYRFSQNTGALTPVVVPGITPAPDGGTFAGVFFGPTINNRGQIVFPGIVTTDQGIHIPNEDYVGLGLIDKADKKGDISGVVIPRGSPHQEAEVRLGGWPPWLERQGGCRVLWSHRWRGVRHSAVGSTVTPSWFVSRVSMLRKPPLARSSLLPTPASQHLAEDSSVKPSLPL